MPDAVVDGLELVEVEEEHGERFVAAVGSGQRLPQAIGEERPIGKPGQGVVEGLVLKLLLERLAVGDVGEEAGPSQGRAITSVEHGSLVAHPANLTRGVDHAVLDGAGLSPRRPLVFLPVSDHRLPVIGMDAA